MSQLDQQGNSSCKQQLKPPKRGWTWPMGTSCPWQSRWAMPLMPLQCLQEVLQLPLGPRPGGCQQRSRVPRARATRSLKAKQETCSRVRGSPSPWTHLLLSTSW